MATNSCHRQQLIRAAYIGNMQLMVANPKDDFAKRLNAACDAAVPLIASERGRIAELRRRVIEKGDTVSGEAVRKWLAGETIPSMNNIRFIAAALNVLADWLLTGRGEMRPGTRAESPKKTVKAQFIEPLLSEQDGPGYDATPVHAAFGTDEETVIKGFRVADAKDREQILWLTQRALDNFERRSEQQ